MGPYEMHWGEIQGKQSLHLKEDPEEEYAKTLDIYIVQGKVGSLKPFLGDGSVNPFAIAVYFLCISSVNLARLPWGGANNSGHSPVF